METTKSLDHAKLADYIHHHTFYTVAGEINYAEDGAWSAPRTLFTQFQHVSGNTLDQFVDTTHEVVVWPKEYKSGDLIYPYAKAKQM